MLNSCEGKSVIVTGASKGIGKGIAAVFARHDAKVLVVARNVDQADACAAELRVGGRQVSAFVGDVTNRSEMEEMTRVAVERNGGIDIFCANAGIFPQSKLEDMSGADWDTVLSTNVKGMHFSIQAALPALKRSKAGRIVSTSLLASFHDMATPIAQLRRPPHVRPGGWHLHGASHDRLDKLDARLACVARLGWVDVQWSWRPMMPHIARARNQ
jgi:NAD(P)-dependent dehydrogenase (short-subunit alcohol dehydrogenase family)